MSFSFDSDGGLVVVNAELKGPSGTALGQTRSGFPVLCHTLPPSSGVDGVLGVDYFHRQVLKIDFRKGRVTVE